MPQRHFLTLSPQLWRNILAKKNNQILDILGGVWVYFMKWKKIMTPIPEKGKLFSKKLFITAEYLYEAVFFSII